MDLRDLKNKIAYSLIQFKLTNNRKTDSALLYNSSSLVNFSNVGSVKQFYVDKYSKIESLYNDKLPYLEVDEDENEDIELIRLTVSIPANERLVIYAYDEEYDLYTFESYDKVENHYLNKYYFIPSYKLNQIRYDFSTDIVDFFEKETNKDVKVLKDNLEVTDIHFMPFLSTLGVYPDKDLKQILTDNESSISQFCRKYDVIFSYAENNLKEKKGSPNSKEPQIGFIKYTTYEKWIETNFYFDYEDDHFKTYQNKIYSEHILKSTLPSFE